MKAPILARNECSVLVALAATGHVYKSDGTMFIKGEGESTCFQVFKSFFAAQNFALKLMEERPEFECVIYDHNGKVAAAHVGAGAKKVKRFAMKRQAWYLLVVAALINGLCYFAVLPYAQKLADSHKAAGSFLGVVFYLFAIAAFVVGINVSIKKDSVRLFLIFAAMVCSFVFWGYQMQHLICQACGQ